MTQVVTIAGAQFQFSRGGALIGWRGEALANQRAASQKMKLSVSECDHHGARLSGVDRVPKQGEQQIFASKTKYFIGYFPCTPH